MIEVMKLIVLALCAVAMVLVMVFLIQMIRSDFWKDIWK